MTQLYGDYVRDTYLIPVVKDKAAAPDKILKLISCGCKQGCTDTTCVCVKPGCSVQFFALDVMGGIVQMLKMSLSLMKQIDV